MSVRSIAKRPLVRVSNLGSFYVALHSSEKTHRELHLPGAHSIASCSKHEILQVARHKMDVRWQWSKRTRTLKHFSWLPLQPPNSCWKVRLHSFKIAPSQLRLSLHEGPRFHTTQVGSPVTLRSVSVSKFASFRFRSALVAASMFLSSISPRLAACWLTRTTPSSLMLSFFIRPSNMFAAMALPSHCLFPFQNITDSRNSRTSLPLRWK